MPSHAPPPSAPPVPQCCVVYGSLPPEVRSRQAALFNAQTTHRVLVATDAIGMGLNLNIRRVVFSQIEKWDGTQNRLLLPGEVRQIAGRAGRFQSIYPEGSGAWVARTGARARACVCECVCV